MKWIRNIFVLLTIITLILLIFLYRQYGYNYLFYKYSILIIMLNICTIIDLEKRIIFDGVIIVGLVIGLIFIIMEPKGLESYSYIGGCLTGGFFAVISFCLNDCIGLGDLKLISVIGLYVGFKMVVCIVFFAFIIAGVIGLLKLIFKRSKIDERMAFAPFLFLGSIISLF